MSINAREILIRDRKTGEDALVDEILSSETSPAAILYAEALKIKRSDTKRGYVEASLLASSDFVEINKILEIPVDILQCYRDIFYNVSTLDKLSKIELIDVQSSSERLMKTWALSQGLDFIAWRLGHTVNLSPVDGLADLFTTCIFKSKEAMFSGNAAESSKEATKWTKLSMDIARLLKVWVMDSGAAKKDIELALRKVDPDFGSLEEVIAEEDREDSILGVIQTEVQFGSIKDLELKVE